MKVLAVNKKAGFNYFIIEKFEAGIQLFGSEVKSIREGKVNMTDSYVTVYNGELLIKNLHISPYPQARMFVPEPKRDRKLLLHKYEISKLIGKISTKGLTIVPTKVYLEKSLIKVEIALCQGKNLHDKRHTTMERETKRETERAIKTFKGRL